ncbi:MAG: N-6 DNA methylase [Planctomycetes bacterium]|nr:N-6 DNA methylase [Planctomycetota bacterium]
MNNKALQSLNFLKPDGKLSTGLFPVHKRRSTKATLCIDERVAVINAELFNRIDFVYFRRFSDGRSSQVAAYVVDNSDEKLDENILAELHLQVWLQGKAPLLYVAWPSRVDVLTCARGPDFWNEQAQSCRYNPAKILNILKTAGEISSEIQRFSAWRLADGTFWEDPHNAKLAKHDKAAHQSLIQAVVEADKDLDGSNNPVLRRLLLLMVLVKYLEDREVFPNNGWFGRFHKGARNFFDVLKYGTPDEVDRLLKFLEVKFNGDVFDLSRLPPRRLTKTNLKTFAVLVEARTLERQRYLWEQFSFRHLPVEIISHLYQRFIKDGHGAVYTPPFLAALLLDHAMPYDKLTGDERILDPACGSGVFLVGAFRKLVNLWRSQNNWKRPNVEKLKNILRQSIYGIDLDSNAIDLAAFSLSLAICDALKPVDIWEKLKFDYLRDSNLFEADFFRLLLDSRLGKPTILKKPFEIIIGNPPFESELTKAGEKVDQASKLKHNSRGSLPDKQVAYLFLEQVLTVLCPKRGRLCLIQPSQLLYTRSPRDFYVNLCRKYRIDLVLDFTSIRNLYEADAKTVAFLTHANNPSEGHWIDHWTFRRTVSVKERICFELDHYDRHKVSQKLAETDPYIWRANLLGGGRLLGISQRLRGFRTLVEYLEKNKQEKKWDYGEGFIAAKTGRREPAQFLTDKPFLPTDAFTSSGIDETQIGTVKETLFRSAYTEERYSAPLILIKENELLPVAFWNKGFLAYRNEIVGIHAPTSDKSELPQLYKLFCDRHDVLRFIVMLHGSRSFISKSTAILKEDIVQLPFPEQPDSLDFCFWEKAIQSDVLGYMADYVRLGQKSDLLRKKADRNDLKSYSSMFCQMLGSIYNNLLASDPIFLNGLTCQPFYFGDPPNQSWLNCDSEDELRKLIYYKNHEHLRTVRIFRLYDENVILIVKPDRLRYWIRSTAIRDADETLIDLRNQGY